MRFFLTMLFAACYLTPAVYAANSGATARAAKVPVTIASARPANVPLWLSAEEAFDASGELRPEKFSEARRSMIDQNLRANASGDCQRFIGTTPETYRPDSTFDELVANALTILSGEVVDAAPGFYAGRPGTLLSIRVAERLKTFGRTGVRDYALIFIDEVRIPTPRGVLCASNFSTVPLPRIGDRVLAFVYFDPVDREGVVLPVDIRTQLVVERADALHLPQTIKMPGHSVAEVADLIRAHAKLHAAVGVQP